MEKAFRYRIYPTAKQEQFLAVQFGASRFVYNYFLAERERIYKLDGTKSSHYGDNSKVAVLKKQPGFEWLQEPIARVLQTALGNLDTAYKRFFKKISERPKFHKKKASRASYHQEIG